MKKRLKLIILYLISVTVSVLPLLLTVILKRGEYIKAPSDAVRLSFGCLVALLFIFAKVIGRLNMPKGVGLYTLVFVLAWLLKPLLNPVEIATRQSAVADLISSASLRAELADALFRSGGYERSDGTCRYRGCYVQ